MKKIAFISFSLLTCFCSIAQMRTSVTVEDYKKCIEYCKGLSNSSEREICMRGCANVNNVFTTVSVRSLERATSFVESLNNKKLNDGENEFFMDKKGQRFYAVSANGRIVDYVVKNKAGKVVPSRVVSVGKETRRCFILLNGELIEVTCPDVIVIIHEQLIR